VQHDIEILPHVRTLEAGSHTPGRTAILLESQGKKLLCVGDTFYDRFQLRFRGWA
jgi:glyoxylase-like metal-dependent hydrolase (beta-lactamase superfamily II)